MNYAETFAAGYEDSHITGSQNDVKSIHSYETPKTETEFFEQFPLPTEVVPEHEESDEQNESASVENSSWEHPISRVKLDKFSAKYYSDKKIIKKFEDSVEITNTVVKKQGRFCVSLAEMYLGNSETSEFLQDKAAKRSSRDEDPITELSLGNSILLKTCSYPEEPDTTDSTLCKVRRNHKFIEFLSQFFHLFKAI